MCRSNELNMNILAQCCERFSLDVIANLKEQCGWEPIVVISGLEVESLSASLFPNALYMDSFDAIRGKYPPLKTGPCEPLSEDLLNEMAQHEALILKMMDRMDPLKIFTYQERERLYHRHLKFWNAFFNSYQVDLAFYPVIPHMVFDYVAYLMAKKRGISTLILNRPAFRGHVFIQNDIDTLPLKLKNTYDELLTSGKIEDLSPRAHAYLQSLRKPANHSAQVHWQHRGVSYSTGQNKAAHAITRQFRKQCNRLLAGGIRIAKGTRKQNPSRIYHKVPGRQIEEVDPLDTIHSRMRKKGKKELSKLIALYSSLCTEPPKKPYVFAALSYQPEQNTSPQAGQFVHQYLMIELLAHALPEGWELYVKEHPATLHLDKKKGECSRDTWFYLDIASLPRTSLAPLDSNTIALVDESRCVATATGTVGWEALVRGKPVLVFGHSWYEYCKGIFRIMNVKQCSHVLEEIASGYTVNHHLTDMYMLAIEKYGVRGFNYDSHAKSAHIDSATNIKNIVAVIRKHLNI